MKSDKVDMKMKSHDMKLKSNIVKVNEMNEMKWHEHENEMKWE